MSEPLCLFHHREHDENCPSCKMRATSDVYRAHLAKLQGAAPPVEKVGEPPRAAAKHTAPPILNRGPGTEAKKLTAAMGISACMSCASYGDQMDRWGVKGCRERFDEIVAHFTEQAQRLGWFRWVTAGATALTKGLPTTPRALVEEAIRRAENGENGHAGKENAVD